MAISNADSVHREHRLLLKQELGRMVLFFTDQPTLLAPNLQVATAFAPQEDLLHSFFSVFVLGFCQMYTNGCLESVVIVEFSLS
jgi:hypothetical protein